MISIAIPFYNMPNAAYFLGRCLASIESQTYKDYEIVITMEGKMAENTNAAIKKCKGEIIKILYMDDYLAHDDALQEIVDNFKGGWLVTGCLHDEMVVGRPHLPYYNEDIVKGENTIGSPSVLTFENQDPLLFDEMMTWMLDCDYYTRLHSRYGPPIILNDLNVVIGISEHQTTHQLDDQTKQDEQLYLIKKHL